MANIKKVGHVVLAVHDSQRSIQFYTEALGMECVRHLEDLQMAFFSFGDERNHDIAVIQVPEEQQVGAAPASPTSHSRLMAERTSCGSSTTGSRATAPPLSSRPTT